MGLDIVELFMAVEKEFGLDIPDEDAVRLQTVGQMHEYVVSGLGATTIDERAALWTRLVDVIENEQGVDRARIQPEASFVHDLGMD